MKKPTSLDHPTMIALNTRIACEGWKRAEASYLAWCHRSDQPVLTWVVRYYQLYAKYHRPVNPLDSYIDVPASIRALEEA